MSQIYITSSQNQPTARQSSFKIEYLESYSTAICCFDISKYFRAGNVSVKNSDPLARISSEIMNLNLTQPNWNGRGADAPSQLAIANALLIVEQLTTAGLLTINKVVPSAEGGVAIVIISTPEKYADFECLNDGSITASYNNRKNIFEAWLIENPLAAGLKNPAGLIKEFIHGN
jgi:hypothetical protein